MKAQIRHVEDHGKYYDCIMFWCPGCVKIDSTGHEQGGLHMLPVNTTEHSPQWNWDGNIEEPTLSPSILTHHDDARGKFVCHSFIKAGMIEFLGDCTHALAGQTVPLPDLPDWTIRSA